MLTSLKVNNIDSTIHEFLKFIIILIYFSKLTKNETFALVFIIRKIHLIDDLKVKMLIKNDFLNSENFIIDIENKTITIESCNIEISLKIQSKDFYVKKQFMLSKQLCFNLKKSNLY